MLKNIKNLNFYTIVILLIIAFPKINILTIPGNSQGIRIEDILILFLLIYNITSIKFNRNLIILISYIVFVSLIGLFINPNEYITLRILSIVRILEYLIVYCIAKKLKKHEIISLVYIIILIELIVIIIQYLINPGDRVKGTTAGPWEVGLIYCAAYIFLISLKNNNDIFLKLFLNCSLVIVLFMTSARMQIVSMAIIALMYISNNFKSIFNKFLSLGSGLYLLYFISNSVDLNYIKFTNVYNGLEDFVEYFIDSLFNPTNFIPLNLQEIDSLSYDISLLSRLNQWIAYLTTITTSKSSLIATIFGSGLNSGGIILDGFYIKVFVDLGLVGVIYYIILLIKLYNNKIYSNYIILLAVSSLTLDILWASKFIYMLILLLSYYDTEHYTSNSK